MIKPKENFFIYTFFSYYISFIIKRHFNKFNFNKVSVDSSKSILLVANHFSWWDGFLYFHLNKIFFKKKFFVMVKEETAREVKFLKYLGAFSVLQSSKSVINSLKFAAELLDNPNHLVLIFPQGNLQSMHTNELNINKGIYKIKDQIKGKWQCIFGVTLVDYFEHSKPQVNIYLANELLNTNDDIGLLFQSFYQNCKLNQGAKSV